jgi:cysteine desulfurase
MEFVYVDNNATTQTDAEVADLMNQVQQQAFASPSSLHYPGRVARKLIDDAREQAATCLAASPGEIIFTSGGTESCHLGILGILNANPGKRHIVTTSVEHLSVKSLCEKLEKQDYEVTRLGVNEHGELDLDELSSSIREDTAIVSLLAANHETGVVWPMKEIGEIVTATSARLHVDAAIAMGWMEVNPTEWQADAVSISGHKFHGPKGSGLLYLRKGVRFSPLFHGGTQERARRPGTENTAAIVGLGKALEMLNERRERDADQISKLRDRFECELLKCVPECVVHGQKSLRVENTSNVSFAYIDGEAILLALSKAGICASSGSACSTGMVEPSYVLRAMGKPDSLAHGAIRFSFSRDNTDQDVGSLLHEIPPAIEQLRAMSPYWQKRSS